MFAKIFEIIFRQHGQEKCECSNICKNRALNIVEFEKSYIKMVVAYSFPSLLATRIQCLFIKIV